MDKGVVGYGKFTDLGEAIEEHDLAEFIYMNDAVRYIEMRRDADFSGNIIYYMDIRSKGKDTLRYIYDPAERQLQSQEDILHNGLHISIPGYIVGGKYEYEADGYEEEPDYNYESRQCVTYKEAERIKENMLDEGYTDIYIDDETISIHDFWESEKFIKGSEQHQERTNTEEALSIYKQFGRPGATIHEMVGTALQHIDTDDMLQYFKDKISGGENLLRDFIENQIVANEINKERSRNEIGRGER